MGAAFKGPAMMATAMLMFSAMGVLVKMTGDALPSTETVMFRGIFSGIVVALMAKRAGASFVGKRTKLLFVRGLAGTAALFLFFFALTKISVGSAILLNQTTPLFIMPMAVIFLKEKITPYHVILAITAAVGVALVVKPSADMDVTPALMALGSAFFAAVAYVLVRKLSATEHPLTIVFWFNLINIVVAVPVAAPHFVMPGFTDWIILIGVALFATLGQILMTLAYRRSEAGRLAVVGSTGAVFGAGFDYLIWDHLPDMLTAVGGVVVIVSCAAMQIIGTSHKRKN